MVYFEETQKFRQVWLWAIMIAALLMSAFIVRQADWQSNGAVAGAIVGIVIPVLILLLFVYMRLETRITEEGIAVRFPPLLNSQRTIPWHQVAEAYVRTYSPLTEYGGWGIRMGLFGKGRAYNVSGNKGLQLVMKDGSKLLIGTQRPEELQTVLEQLRETTGVGGLKG